MLNLADLGTLCLCGASSLAPAGDLEPGSLVICAVCAQPARVAVCLVPVNWHEVEDEFADRPLELASFRWHRAGARLGVPAEVARPRLWGFGAPARSTLALGSAFVALLLILFLRAVCS